MLLKHFQRVGQLSNLPDAVSELAESLLQKSLGNKIEKIKFNFAFINDVPKRIQQYKTELKNLPGLLPPVYKYELFYIYADTGIKDYMVYIGIDDYLQILHYNLPLNPTHTIKALYGENQALKKALDYAVAEDYNTEVDSIHLKYSLDKHMLVWTVYLLQEKINSSRKKCLAIEINVQELKDIISATEVELVEETITSIEMEEERFEPPPPPPPLKKEDV